MSWLFRALAATVVPGFLVVALIASSAGAAVAGQPIVCPLSGVPPCCPVPVGGTRAPPRAPAAAPVCCPVPTGTGCCLPTTTPCCTGTTCGPALSISLTPDPGIAGRDATITGALTGGTTTVAAQTVTLWRRLAGQAAFTQVAQTQTDSAGGFKFVQVVHTNAAWYAKAGTVVSGTVSEPVRAAIAIRASTHRPALGARLKLTGSVAPSHAGERVALERRRGRHWVTIARPQLSAMSRFAIAWRMGARGTQRFRVVLVGDARNARSVSAVLAVRVI